MHIQEHCIDIRDSKNLTILPFSCLHWGSPACHISLFQQFLEESKENNTYIVGLGDYMEFARTTYRNALKSLNTGENQHDGLDRLVLKETEELYDVMKPFSRNKRVLGFIEGNHRWEFSSYNDEYNTYPGLSTTEYLCRELSIPYLGYSAILRLNIKITDKVRDTYDIFLHHGHGSKGSNGGGASLAYIEQKIEPTFQANAYLLAHDHRIISYNLPTLIPQFDQKIVREQSKLLVRAGSFYKGYLPTTKAPTYAELKVLRPLNLGWVKIALSYEYINNKWVRNVESTIKSHTYICE